MKLLLFVPRYLLPVSLAISVSDVGVDPAPHRVAQIAEGHEAWVFAEEPTTCARLAAQAGAVLTRAGRWIDDRAHGVRRDSSEKMVFFQREPACEAGPAPGSRRCAIYFDAIEYLGILQKAWGDAGCGSAPEKTAEPAWPWGARPDLPPEGAAVTRVAETRGAGDGNRYLESIQGVVTDFFQCPKPLSENAREGLGRELSLLGRSTRIENSEGFQEYTRHRAELCGERSVSEVRFQK